MKVSPLYPLLLMIGAALCVAAWAGGMGIVFIFLNSTSIGENGPIILGVVLVIAVPVLGAIVSSMVGKSTQERHS